MNAEFELKYQLMNAGHLLVDEVEYELTIRQVPFNVGDSRDVKRRRLRQKLKEQKEKNDFEVDFTLSSDECLRDLHVVDEKLAKIRDQLENRRTKKSELPELQTRLVHLYARLLRLKKKVDTDGLEGILLKLYQEHFTFLSTDPDVRKRTEENLSRQLMDLSVQNRSEEGTDTKSEENEDSSDGEHRNEQEKAKDKDRNTSTPKEKRKSRKEKDSEEMFKRLLEHVDSYLDSKLSSVSGERRKGDSSSCEDLDSEEARKYRRKETHRRMRKRSSSEDAIDEEESRSHRCPGKSTKKRNRREVSSPRRKSKNQRSESSSGESSDRQKRGRRQPRSIAEWKMKYDGKDEGKKLNKFIIEVEFMAEAESLSKRDLFNEAIHLFSGEARSWYIEGRKNRDFRNWRELVAELKQEFQPPDMDFHYEQQAVQRRQKRSEKFQDYFNAVMEIFQYMAVAPSEQRMFDIVFRNLRSDYKNVLVVKGIRTLKGLKQWGRKLDSVNVWMYRNREAEVTPKSVQVHEVRRQSSRNEDRPVESRWKSAPQTGKGLRSNQKDDVERQQLSNRQEVAKDDQRPRSSKADLESRIANYKVPDKLTCFNCRGKYHHHQACLSEKEVFCTICGFHNYTKERCPFCAKNGRTSA